MQYRIAGYNIIINFRDLKLQQENFNIYSKETEIYRACIIACEAGPTAESVFRFENINTKHCMSQLYGQHNLKTPLCIHIQASYTVSMPLQLHMCTCPNYLIANHVCMHAGELRDLTIANTQTIYARNTSDQTRQESLYVQIWQLY